MALSETFCNAAAIMLLAATCVDFAIVYILAPFYSGYSHRKQVMSALGNPDSPVRVIYNIWLVILGLLLLVASPLIYARFSGVSAGLSVTIVIFIDVFAVGAGVIAGIFSVNADKSVSTTASKIHGASAAIGFMALLFVPLLIGILSFSQGDATEGVISIVSFAAALVFFTLFVMADKPEFKNTIIALEGLWQRLSLLFMYLPLAYLAARTLIDNSTSA